MRVLRISQRWSGRLRRLTALVAACAFLLAVGLASHHADAGPAHEHPASYPGVPGLHTEECSPGHDPGDCLACLWGRTAVAGAVPAGPSVACACTDARLAGPSAGGYRQPFALRHPSRGPPASLLQ